MKEDLTGIMEEVPDKKYRIMLSINGKRPSKTFYGTLSEAIEDKEKFTTEQESKNKNPNSEMPFLDVTKLWLKVKKKQMLNNKLDANTLFGYRRILNSYILPYFQNWKLCDIENHNIDDFFNLMRKTENKNKKDGSFLSETTVDHAYDVLNMIFNWAISANVKLLNNSPCADLKSPPKPKKNKKINYLQEEEMEEARNILLKYANIRLKCAMSIVFDLGCRREEVVGLKWEHINFVTGFVDFNDAITAMIPANENDGVSIRIKELKSDNGERLIPLTQMTLDLLKKYKKFKELIGMNVEDEDRILTNWQENKVMNPNKLTSEWKTFRDKYKLKDVHVHGIRHSLSNYLLSKGIPKKDVAHFLGQDERTLSDFYTQSGAAESNKIKNIIEERFNKKKETFDIESIVSVISGTVDNNSKNRACEVLDFLIGNTVLENEFNRYIEICKEYLIKQFPKLKIFDDDILNTNKELFDIKLETYKELIGSVLTVEVSPMGIIDNNISI